MTSTRLFAPTNGYLLHNLRIEYDYPSLRCAYSIGGPWKVCSYRCYTAAKQRRA